MGSSSQPPCQLGAQGLGPLPAWPLPCPVNELRSAQLQVTHSENAQLFSNDYSKLLRI